MVLTDEQVRKLVKLSNLLDEGIKEDTEQPTNIKDFANDLYEGEDEEVINVKEKLDTLFTKIDINIFFATKGNVRAALLRLHDHYTLIEEDMVELYNEYRRKEQILSDRLDIFKDIINYLDDAQMLDAEEIHSMIDEAIADWDEQNTTLEEAHEVIIKSVDTPDSPSVSGWGDSFDTEDQTKN